MKREISSYDNLENNYPLCIFPSSQFFEIENNNISLSSQFFEIENNNISTNKNINKNISYSIKPNLQRYL